MRALGAAVLLLACAHASAQPLPSVGPFVQDVRSDGFTVAFATPAPATAEVRAGGLRVATPRGTWHEAVLRGLAPAARVTYQVVVDGADAGGGQVVLPDPTRPLTFVVYGDTRDGGEAEATLATFAASLQPDLALHTGDLVRHGADMPSWDQFFANERTLMRDVPLYPTLGNHEVYRDPAATNFRRFFSLPEGGRERLYYHFRFGSAEFIVLDGNAPTPAQTDWLRATLEAARRAGVPHLFVLVHQPPFSVGTHCGAALSEADWVALFEEYGVRAVFAGHDHAYARMERRGVRYFVSGGGGAPVYQERPCEALDRAALRVYRPVHHLLRVHVDGPAVEVAALTPEGGAPLDVTHFSAGDPPVAMDAPPLRPAAPDTPPWTLAGSAVIFVLLGILVRRKRIR